MSNISTNHFDEAQNKHSKKIIDIHSKYTNTSNDAIKLKNELTYEIILKFLYDQFFKTTTTINKDVVNIILHYCMEHFISLHFYPYPEYATFFTFKIELTSGSHDFYYVNDMLKITNFKYRDWFYFPTNCLRLYVSTDCGNKLFDTIYLVKMTRGAYVQLTNEPDVLTLHFQ